LVANGGAETFTLTGVNGTWTPVPGASPSALKRAMVRIGSGQVVVTATDQPIGIPGKTTLQIYDSVQNQFGAASAAIPGADCAMSAVFLPIGRVLLVGGNTGSSSAIIYDANAGTFTADDPTPNPHSKQSATMLANGDVLVVGGDKAAADLRPWPGG